MNNKGIGVLGGGEGCRDGIVVRTFASHQCGPGSIPSIDAMWVEFVIGSHLHSKGFCPDLMFSSLLKNILLKR